MSFSIVKKGTGGVIAQDSAELFNEAGIKEKEEESFEEFLCEANQYLKVLCMIDLCFLKNGDHSSSLSLGNSSIPLTNMTDTGCSDELARISKKVIKISSRLSTYLEKIASQKEKSEEYLKSLSSLREGIEEASKHLLEFQNADKSGEKESQIIKNILKEFRNILLNLPETLSIEKIVVRTFFERVKGTFIRSNDPIDNGWKILCKYEPILWQIRVKIEKYLKENKEKGSVEPVQTILKEIKKIQLMPEKGEKRFTLVYLGAVRRGYSDNFLGTLRAQIAKYPENVHLQKIAKILFMEIVIENELKEMIKVFMQMGKLMLNDKKEIPEDLIGRMEAIKRYFAAIPYTSRVTFLDQCAKSACGQWNRYFDSGAQGNPIHLFYQIILGKKTVKALAFGSPTEENAYGKAILAPEFVAFIRALKAEGKRFLFVLNQNMIPKTSLKSVFINGDETARGKLILDFQYDFKAKGSYFAIALSKDSPFYHQEEKWAKIDSSVEFKKELFNQVFKMPRNKSGCYIPEIICEYQCVDGQTIQEKSENMIDVIHKKLFQEQKILSVDERLIFIETYYDHLVLLIIKEMQMDSFIEVCKDLIDRGAASNAQLYALVAIAYSDNNKLSKEDTDRICRIMFLRAELVRKRHPIGHRVDRLILTLRFYLKRKKELLELGKALFQDAIWKVTGSK